MYNAEVVAIISTVAFFLFMVPLFIGAVSTIARVVFYRVHGITRPRLLTRDAIVFGGLSVSFGQITLARFLGPDVRAVLADNVLWALSTSIPAVIAVVTYAYFELFIIERAKS